MKPTLMFITLLGATLLGTPAVGNAGTCLVNDDCGAYGLCMYPEGSCGATPGRCRRDPAASRSGAFRMQRCLERCGGRYEPVCTCRGISVSNKCFARCQGLSVLHEGLCTEDAICVLAELHCP